MWRVPISFHIHKSNKSIQSYYFKEIQLNYLVKFIPNKHICAIDILSVGRTQKRNRDDADELA